LTLVAVDVATVAAVAGTTAVVAAETDVVVRLSQLLLIVVAGHAGAIVL